MYKSILQFNESGTIRLDNICADFFENPKDVASFVNGVKDEMLRFACEFIGDAFEELNGLIKSSSSRKDSWEIVRNDQKSMLTSIGEINYTKTLYINKKTGLRTYLLDKYLDIEENARLTEDAEACILEEAVQTSYRRGGEAVSILDKVSKSTVKNKLHSLAFPKQPVSSEKKQIKYLYIDADEDHVPLQFFESKGDIIPDEKGRKYNNVPVKLVYVYEGIRPVAPKSNRYELINPRYFSGVYEGKSNAAFWDEIAEYIEQNYDTEKIEKIYLNADGGSWIKGWKTSIHGITTVLDEYHINKELTKMTSHLWDSKEEAKDTLRSIIRNGTKPEFVEKTKLLKEHAEDKNTIKRIDDGCKYILSNWTAAKLRMRRQNGVVGSSTEGHVSHVLASRMSSRPLGWSKHGAHQMGQLRAYSWNKGNMLELVRFQKENNRQKNKDEQKVWLRDILASERQHNPNGKYYDKIQCSIPAQARKILAIRENIGLN